MEIGSVIVVNYVVDRSSDSLIENGVESVKKNKKGEKKERKGKIAQGGNDYEIWKSRRVGGLVRVEECQIISRNEETRGPSFTMLLLIPSILTRSK